MKKKFLTGLGIGLFLLSSAGFTFAVDDATVQQIQEDAATAKTKADTNAVEIQSLKGGLPTERAERISADAALQEQIDNIELTPGPEGKSAYEIAVGNGFVGTEAEWLNSLTGPSGPEGAAGAPGADGQGGLSAYEIAVLNGFIGTKTEWLNSLVGPEGPVGPDGAAGPQGPQGPQGPAGVGQIINLTIDPAQFPGIVAQDFFALFPDTVLNTAYIEVEGVCGGEVIVINGPAYEIQVVEGFDGLGKHNDQSGLSQELPFIIEVPAIDQQAPSVQNCTNLHEYFSNYKLGLENRKSMSLIVKNLEGLEQFRWNLFEFEPNSFTPGIEGTRYTFVQSSPPDNLDYIQRDPPDLPNESSYNPATDFLVEIEGVSGLYPAVVETTDHSLTLVYDFVEGNGHFEWVRNVIKFGTTSIAKRSISVVTLSETMTEVSRTNYYGCFPKKYEQFTGFTQDVQTKERIIVHCDFSEPAL